MIATKSTEPVETRSQQPESAPSEPSAEQPLRLTKEKFAALVKAANQGDEEARKRVRQLLDARPDIWRTFGDLDCHARAALIQVLTPAWATSESIERVMAAMKAELAGPDPSGIVNMAAEQVVICWAYLRHTEMNALDVTGSLSERRFRDKVVDQAHRRFLESIKLLGALTGVSAGKAGTIVTRSQIAPGEPGEPEVHDCANRTESATGLKEEPTEQDRSNGHSFDQESTGAKAA